MKNEKADAAVASAYGEKIPEIKFSFEYEKYESASEVQEKYTKGELDELILGAANAASKANARAKATTLALDSAGYKKPDMNSPEMLRKGMISNLVKAKGYSEEKATQIVDGLLGA